MKIQKYEEKRYRIPFYYRLFSLLKDAGVNVTHLKNLSEMCGFKSPNSISRDFEAIGVEGQKKYGFNTAYMVRFFKEKMSLSRRVTYMLIGAEVPAFSENIPGYIGLDYAGASSVILPEIIEEYNVEMLIILCQISDNALYEVKDNIKCVINMSGTELSAPLEMKVIELDPVSIMLDAWYEATSDVSESEK